MQITYKSDYALKSVLELAVRSGEGPIQTHQLAAKIDAPVKFLEQVLLELKRGGFVESRRGKEGGFLLAREPERIRVGDVVRFIEGPIGPIACVSESYADCKDLYKCLFRGIWKQVAQATSDIIDNITFRDLADRVKQRGAVLDFQI